MTSVGYATLDVIPSFRGLSRELDRGTTGPLAAAGDRGGRIFGDRAGKAAGARFGSIFKSAAKASLVGLAAAGAGAIKLGVDSISAASDLEESTNKVSQVFGDSADKILRFTSTTADALGQTNQQAREAAATFGIFGSAAGLTDRKSARFAKRMTTLASDLASFNNTEPDQAVDALGAALRGESEPIRAYGVLLDEATLKAEALRLGLLKPVKDKSKIFAYQTRVTDLQAKYNEAVEENGKGSLEALKAEAALGTARSSLQKATEGTLPPLTKQQKLLAAQSEIFKQTSVAQGDFSRTSDGLANQQRRLSARFEDAKAKLGVGLLPIMTDAADFLLDEGIPAFEDFSEWFNKKGIPALEDFGGFVKDTSGKVKTLVGFLKDLPKPAQFAGLTALIGGVGALKLRGGAGGALGTAGKALGLAKPVPVLVTNPGFGAGAGDGGVGGKGKGALLLNPATLFIGQAVIGTITANKNLDKAVGPETASAIITGKQGEGIGAGLFSPDYFAETDKSVDLLKVNLDAARAKAAGFGTELDLVGARKITATVKDDQIDRANDAWAKFTQYQIDAGRPVTPFINTTSIERAIALARTLDATLPGNVNVNAGTDGGANYISGGGGANQRAGVNFNGPINIQAHDYNDFTRQLERKTQRRGLGGR